MTRDEAKHLALNILCSNKITPREMELDLARAFLALESRLAKAEAFKSVVREYFDEDISAGSKWNKKYFPRYHAVLDALREYDAQGGGELFLKGVRGAWHPDACELIETSSGKEGDANG
jgi:hypothetical protein